MSAHAPVPRGSDPLDADIFEASLGEPLHVICINMVMHGVFKWSWLVLLDAHILETGLGEPLYVINTRLDQRQNVLVC